MNLFDYHYCHFRLYSGFPYHFIARKPDEYRIEFILIDFELENEIEHVNFCLKNEFGCEFDEDQIVLKGSFTPGKHANMFWDFETMSKRTQGDEDSIFDWMEIFFLLQNFVVYYSVMEQAWRLKSDPKQTWKRVVELTKK